MPSKAPRNDRQPRKNRTPHAGHHTTSADQQTAPEHANPAKTVTTPSGDGTLAAHGWCRFQVSVWIPPIPRVTGVTAIGGTTGLTIAGVTGHVEPLYVWPSVILSLGGMAYDLVRRVIDDRRAREG